jgi:hypothetical protein
MTADQWLGIWEEVGRKEHEEIFIGIDVCFFNYGNDFKDISACQNWSDYTLLTIVQFLVLKFDLKVVLKYT